MLSLQSGSAGLIRETSGNFGGGCDVESDVGRCVLAATLMVLCGCTPTKAPPSAEIVDPDGGARTEVFVPEEGDDTVRLVLVRTGATLYRTANGDGAFELHPSDGQDPRVEVPADMQLPAKGIPMQLEAELGDRLKVSTWSNDFGYCWSGSARIWEPLDLVFYVDREDLVEVTTAKVVATYPDRSRIEIWPGAALAPTEVPGRYVAAGWSVAVLGVPSAARGHIFVPGGPDPQASSDLRPHAFLPTPESGELRGPWLPLFIPRSAERAGFGRGVSARSPEPLEDGTTMVTVGDSCMQARLRISGEVVPPEGPFPPRLYYPPVTRAPDPMEPGAPENDARDAPYIGECPETCQTVQRNAPAFWEDGSRAGTVRDPWTVAKTQPATGRLCYRFYFEQYVCFEPEDVLSGD